MLHLTKKGIGHKMNCKLEFMALMESVLKSVIFKLVLRPDSVSIESINCGARTL